MCMNNYTHNKVWNYITFPRHWRQWKPEKVMAQYARAWRCLASGPNPRASQCNEWLHVLSNRCVVATDLLLTWFNLNPSMGEKLQPILWCGVRLLVHYQTSTVLPHFTGNAITYSCCLGKRFIVKLPCPNVLQGNTSLPGRWPRH